MNERPGMGGWRWLLPPAILGLLCWGAIALIWHLVASWLA